MISGGSSQQSLDMGKKVLEMLQNGNFEGLMQMVMGNQLFIGLALTSILGGLAYLGRSIPSKIFTTVKKLFVCQLTVTDEDNFSSTLSTFIYEQVRLKKNLEVVKFNEKKANFGIAPGTYYFKWKGYLFMATRSKEKKASRVHEEITVRTLSISPKPIEELIKELRSRKYDKNTIEVQMSTGGIVEKRKRPFESIYINDDVKQELKTDLDWFVQNPEWFQQRGIPYKRGYLLEGPPGNGKSSLSLAIASYLNWDVCFINLGSIKSGMSIDRLINRVSPRTVAVIEDIDALTLTHMRKQIDEAKNRQKTDLKLEREGELKLADNAEAEEFFNDGEEALGTFLNFLDGLISPENVIFVMTSNHPEKLDPALIRKGRVDKRIHLENPREQEKRAMIRGFFPEIGKTKENEILEEIKSEDLNASSLQQLLIEMEQ